MVMISGLRRSLKTPDTYKTGDNGNAIFPSKVRISKIPGTRQKISVPLAMSTNLRKKRFELFKNPEKNNPWGDLGPRSA